MSNPDIANVVSKAWERIESWATTYFPQLHITFAEGASVEVLDKLEQFLAYPLPSSLKASFARHNGQIKNPALIWYKDVYRLLSVEEIIEELEYRITSSKTKEKVASLPIAKAATGDKIWININDKGEAGAMRLRLHDSLGVPQVQVSFLDWINELASDLEAGRYCIDKYGSLARKFLFDEALEKLIIEKVNEVAASKGDVAMLINRLALATNQPGWIVTHNISEYRLEFLLEEQLSAYAVKNGA